MQDTFDEIDDADGYGALDFQELAMSLMRKLRDTDGDTMRNTLNAEKPGGKASIDIGARDFRGRGRVRQRAMAGSTVIRSAGPFATGRARGRRLSPNRHRVPPCREEGERAHNQTTAG